jgi:serine/threonine protein kinase
LHEKKYIYRDLKLENLMFDKDGYLVLVDFGLASKLDGNNVCKTFVGT